MNEWIQEFSKIIVTQREWTWSVIGILYMSLTLIIRNWVLRSLIRDAKDLKRSHYSDFKENYLKLAFNGWIFYFASVVIVLFVWTQKDLWPLKTIHASLLVAAGVSYLLSITSHVHAIGFAAIATLKKSELEKV